MYFKCNPDINKNGARFLNFLDLIDSVHINGACRIPGNLSTKIAKGLWTRQRCGSKSVLDYAVISKEHLHSVHSMSINDTGQYSANSDHNWLFLKVSDQFMIQKFNSSIKHKKDRWDIKPDQDWSMYKKHVFAGRRYNSDIVDSLTATSAAIFQMQQQYLRKHNLYKYGVS